MKEAPGIYTSTLASKTDLAGLEAKVENLDLYKLRIVTADLSKLA